MEQKDKIISDPSKIQLAENRDFQQVLGAPPGWILHWGITVVFIAIIILLGIGWLIKYPDIIPARVILTTENPPIRIFSKSNGKIELLNVKNDERVKAGHLIAIIENPADWKDILRLDSFLNEVRNAGSVEKISALEIPRNLRLGPVQSSYAEFAKQFDENLFFLQNNLSNARIANLNAQIVQLNEMIVALSEQKKVQTKVTELAKKDLERDVRLKAIGAISDTELETSEAAYLQQQQALDKLDNDIINNKILIEKNRMLILESRQQNLDTKSAGFFTMRQIIQHLDGEIENWKQSYLITAPIDGTVALIQFWSQQQYIRENEEFATIVPDNGSGDVVGRAVLPLERSGKVMPGMKANIRLDGYPYQEFGSIEATVKDISAVPQGDAYQVLLEIRGMHTTYDKSIPFRQEMQGTANIISEDRSIIQRIFYKLLSILKR